MNPVELMQKAKRALAGARVLMAAEDSEGACSRADYAMFDAARAALLAVGADTEQAAAKTHRGLLAAFGKHLVLSGHVAAELGRSFNQAQNLRMNADYTGEVLSLGDAAWAIDEAEVFIATLRAKLVDPETERGQRSPNAT